MSQNDTQIGVRVNESLWQEFREDVEARKGGIRGHLKTEVETALREYINASDGGDTHDRLVRIESDIQTIAQSLSEMQSKEKDADVGSKVESRADEIQEIIREETGKSPVVGDGVLEMAIKRAAGHSDPTLRQYKDILRDRETLYPHPAKSDKWVRDKQEFVKMTQQLRQNDVISQQRYESLVTDFGVDEFKQVYREQEDAPERGVQ